MWRKPTGDNHEDLVSHARPLAHRQVWTPLSFEHSDSQHGPKRLVWNTNRVGHVRNSLCLDGRPKQPTCNPIASHQKKRLAHAIAIIARQLPHLPRPNYRIVHEGRSRQPKRRLEEHRPPSVSSTPETTMSYTTITGMRSARYPLQGCNCGIGASYAPTKKDFNTVRRFASMQPKGGSLPMLSFKGLGDEGGMSTTLGIIAVGLMGAGLALTASFSRPKKRR
jgi:hypothetical protein